MGESTRSNSRGVGTMTLTYPDSSEETYGTRSMVHDSCDALTGIVEGSDFPILTFVRQSE